jgi:DNA modification methylase
MSFILYNENCLDVLKRLEDNSLDSIVTDPPYGLSFMGKKWDYDVPSVEIWAECLRVLKPGGHLLAFAGTRTQHRMAVRIEDAGFEIRDMIAWVYGSGFPKSHDVSKAIDKQAGEERADALAGGHRGIASDDVQTDGYKAVKDAIGHGVGCGTASRGTPVTDAAQQWQGWGTALKPALEPITVARKPLIGTVAENVLEHGTGALNIDGCRVGVDGGTAKGSKPIGVGNGVYGAGLHGACEITQLDAGRWPANLIHDGSDEVVGLFPQSSGGAWPANGAQFGYAGGNRKQRGDRAEMADTGSAARFFYCAKASKRDRDEGLEGFDQVKVKTKSGGGAPNEGREASSDGGVRANVHPTVKPTDLMRYLCRLVTPPGGVVLDPFMGSGSTGKAAMIEGFQFIGCEMSPEYFEIAKARIEAAKTEPTQKDMFVIPK